MTETERIPRLCQYSSRGFIDSAKELALFKTEYAKEIKIATALFGKKCANVG